MVMKIMEKFIVHIVSVGTKIYINEKNEYNIIKETGCIWGKDKNIYFSPESWELYKSKRKEKRVP